MELLGSVILTQHTKNNHGIKQKLYLLYIYAGLIIVMVLLNAISLDYDIG